ncbi:MAG: class D sortase [Gemmatimonadaceae bacterium]|nr:class D sortase [Gemmatimonadaceae bacterium]
MSRSSAIGVSRVAARPRRSLPPPRRFRGAKIFGLSIFAAGLIVVSIVAVQILRGTIARERARAEWAKLMQSSSLNAVATLGMKRARSGAPVTRVVIPSIRLDEVVVEGLNDRELWAGPGHMPGTVFPGENGNSVISAHRDRHFHRLDDVRVGDVIETQTLAMSVMWRVKERQIVDKDAKVIFEAASPRLTLTTCWPTRYIGSAPDRLLIIAEPISMRERTIGQPAAQPAAAAAQ